MHGISTRAWYSRLGDGAVMKYDLYIFIYVNSYLFQSMLHYSELSVSHLPRLCHRNSCLKLLLSLLFVMKKIYIYISLFATQADQTTWNKIK